MTCGWKKRDRKVDVVGSDDKSGLAYKIYPKNQGLKIIIIFERPNMVLIWGRRKVREAEKATTSRHRMGLGRKHDGEGKGKQTPCRRHSQDAVLCAWGPSQGPCPFSPGRGQAQTLST